MSPLSDNEKYWLNRDKEETTRLESQHEYLKRVLNRKHPLPSTINPTSISTVLDVAAGSFAWILDLARTPGIKERIRPRDSSTALSAFGETQHDSTRKEVKLYACDLSDAQFPPQEILREFNITAFRHDICKSFPSNLKGKFDLIHMRLLVFALSEAEWLRTLENLRELLAPEGRLLLVDLNMTWYNCRRPFPDDWRYVPITSWQTRNDEAWIDHFNETMRRSLIERNHFVPDLVHRLPTLLKLAGWSILTRNPFITPVGALCHQFPGPLGQNVAAEEEATIRMTSGVYNAITRNILKVESNIQKEDGRDKEYSAITTETERQIFMDNLINMMRREGALCVWVEILANQAEC